MLCQECQKHSATVYITRIINGHKSEVHLCEICAQEKDFELSFDFDPKFSIQNLLAGLLNYEGTGSALRTRHQAKMQCSNCGLTFAQFAQIGRFGCSNCYESFAKRFHPLLKRIHGSQVHSGKIPCRAGKKIRLKRKFEQLKNNLKQHVMREEFEEAARLRDKIRQLEKKSEKESEGEGKNE